MIAFIPLILFSVLLNATAQLLLKKGMHNLELSASLDTLKAIVLNLWVLGGLGIYAISIVSWLVVLARVNVSVAYPFLSVGFIFSAIVAHYTLGESLNALKIVGIVLICAGLVALTRG